MRELEDLALAFDRACRRAGVDYAFIGGIAVVAWGQPRTTMDVDALVRLSREKVGALVEAVASERLKVDAQDLLDAIRDGSHASAFDQRSPLHVDVKIARTADEVAEVREAQQLDVAGGTIRVVRAEDAVAFKLKFGSDQDFADARSILTRRKGKLDEKYLEAVAARLGVTDSLRRAREEIRNAGF